ncbi:MAG: N-methylhydantoinase B/acetone carboxylase, alpha subunit, partial [Blastococcus sp.]|nr:N-methylhydantoinase B/acetone carboxylase, alpha subunit [Blastococcus sp.]
GGGGWGDPLDRPVDEVLRDIAWRKVSVAGARADYGVVVLDSGEADLEATETLRASIRAERTGAEPFFDRGPGYATLSGGATYNEFDVL